MSKPRVLAVSYAFPPMAFAQSIQISRFLRSLNASVTVVCGSDTLVKLDETIAPGIEQQFDHILREPFRRPKLLRYLDIVLERCHLAFHNLPDSQRSWALRLVPRVRQALDTWGFRPDVLMTFGMPMSDHLFGLRYKQQTGVPWVAHFSDPWTDNPFRNRSTWADRLESQQEREVFDLADALVFTSPETLDLVMSKYADAYRHKARVIPHSHRNSSDMDEQVDDERAEYVIRCIGSFYGPRSPGPFFEALERVAEMGRDLLANVRVEFVGPMGDHRNLLEAYPAARKIVRQIGSVDYSQSLALMRSADCLLLIDAPAKWSVFFPSKLAEYIGSNNFIFALTPPGTSARIVNEVGGVVVNPEDGARITADLRTLLETRPRRLPHPTARYEERTVALAINELLDSVVGSRL